MIVDGVEVIHGGDLVDHFKICHRGDGLARHEVGLQVGDEPKPVVVVLEVRLVASDERALSLGRQSGAQGCSGARSAGHGA